MSKERVVQSAAEKLDAVCKELMMEAAKPETANGDLTTYAEIIKRVAGLSEHIRQWKDGAPR